MADVVAGRAVWEAGVDRSKLSADVAAANAEITAAGKAAEAQATASATSTLQKIQGLSRQAISTVAMGAGAIFAAGTKLAAEGESAMASFRAETGATQKEAEDALASMNRLAGQNLQSFSTIADALTQVRTQMGLTGAAADDMTSAVLKFSTATGTDAVANVKAFDDVSDAWNLTAQDTKNLMDELVVSHQRYGGSISESQQLLQQLAPTLQAANMNWQDAIGLINLFNHAGVGAEAAATGLNRALQKVKSPEELQRLIKDVAATEDPFERAQKAADLFGNRAGPKLAQALADSGGDLTAFGISMDDAAGATAEAANAIQSTLPNQIKMAVEGALGQARTFATDIGPALLGASSLASVGTSIASALKLDTALKGALSKAWQATAVDSGVLEAIATAGRAWGPALLKSIGVLAIPFALQPLGDAMKPTIDLQTLLLGEGHNAYVEAQKQGDEAGHAFVDGVAAALADGKSQQEAIEAGRVAANNIAAAVLKATSRGGGGGWSEAIAREFIKGIISAVQTEAGRSLSGAALVHALGPALLDHPAGSFPVAIGGPIAKAFVQSIITNVQLEAGRSLSGGALVHALGPDLFAHDTSFKKLGHSAGAPIVQGIGEAITGRVATSYVTREITGNVQAAVTAALPALGSAGKKGGRDVGEGLVIGLKSTKSDVASEMGDLRDALLHPLRGIHTVAKVEGALASKELAAGLKSKDPETQHIATQIRNDLIAKLQKLKDEGYPIGEKALAQLGLGIVDGKIVAITAATTANTQVTTALSDTSGVRSGGAAIGNAWVAGLVAALNAGHGNANDALLWYNHRTIGQSPPPEGPLKDIDKGGHNIGRAWALGIAGGMRSVGLDGMLGFGGPLQTLSVGATQTLRHEGTVTIRVDGRNLPPGITNEGLGAAIASRLDLGEVLAHAERTAHLSYSEPRR